MREHHSLACHLQLGTRRSFIAAHMNHTADIDERDFETQVLKSPLPVLVEFGAPWSRPCRIIDSVLNEVAKALNGKAKVLRVNADDSLGLSLSYDIQSVPTLLYFVGGRPQVRIVGTATKEAILGKLEGFRTQHETRGS